VSDPRPTLRAALAAALAHLESHRREVNDLNVFPVADGDTGDNLVHTVRAALAELERVDPAAGREALARALTRGALVGARGNSGVILSQLVRGAADVLGGPAASPLDGAAVAAALGAAAQRARAAVPEPVEGTMLTVVGDMARAVERAAPAGDGDALAAGLARALDAGEDSLRRGPQLLDVLRREAVVDAGGLGVLLIVAGLAAALRGAPPRPVRVPRPAAAPGAGPRGDGASPRFCTSFLVTGSALEAQAWTDRLAALGDSVLVVGDEGALKVHLHTDAPQRAAALFAGVGAVSGLEVADLREQERERDRRLAGPRTAALAVVAGEGLRALYASLGVRTLHPAAARSAPELRGALDDLAGDEVVVLADGPEVLAAAALAAERGGRPVEVVAVGAPQAGLVAAVALDPARPATANARALEDALARVRTGSVGAGPAGAVGHVEGERVAAGAPGATLREVVARLGRDAELVTCLAADDAPLDAAGVRALAPPGVELEVVDGGQPGPWWLLAAE
jgi:DAK2 domain fusion protein YloV